jgi:hypothetical protein
MEGDSGAILDLGLLFPDIGIDNLRIQEPRDETESLTPLSSEKLSLCASPARIRDHRRAAPFCVGESILRCEGRRRKGREEDWVVDEDPVALGVLRLSGVTMVELVAGRETREGVPKLKLSPSAATSPDFLFFDEGCRFGEEWSGFPNARPAAATPTVLEATSWKKYN